MARQIDDGATRIALDGTSLNTQLDCSVGNRPVRAVVEEGADLVQAERPHGRPDLIINRSSDAFIIDVKTGQEQHWRTVQLQIYQYALSKALPKCFRHAKLAGEVVCASRIARVPRGALPGQFIYQLGSTIRRLAAHHPPTAPSRCSCIHTPHRETPVPATPLPRNGS